jgi:L,D-transpeptidase ErfK/SrfK
MIMAGFTRRSFVTAGGAFLATQGLSETTNVNSETTTEQESDVKGVVRHNISSFRALDWRPYFDTLKNGAILVDISSRALHFWSQDEETYRLYPTSVPMTEDLTKRGYTKIIKKVEGPSWRPTPAMRKRNPEWPEFIEPGPDNPLGTHALYLSWTYFRIHGTHDTRKIGRRSSNGCIGLYNSQIAELFAATKVGTQVLII